MVQPSQLRPHACHALVGLLVLPQLIGVVPDALSARRKQTLCRFCFVGKHARAAAAGLIDDFIDAAPIYTLRMRVRVNASINSNTCICARWFAPACQLYPRQTQAGCAQYLYGRRTRQKRQDARQPTHHRIASCCPMNLTGKRKPWTDAPMRKRSWRLQRLATECAAALRTSIRDCRCSSAPIAPRDVVPETRRLSTAAI